MKTQNEYEKIVLDGLTQVKYYLDRHGLSDMVFDIYLVVDNLYLDDYLTDIEYNCTEDYIDMCIQLNELIGVNECICTPVTNDLINWIDKQINLLSFD